MVAVIAYNDAYVMSAWGKANQVTGDDIVRVPSPNMLRSFVANMSQLFLSDPEAKFSKSIGWADAEGRTGRYAIIIDHGKVTYAAREKEKNALEVRPEEMRKLDSANLFPQVSDATTILKNL